MTVYQLLIWFWLEYIYVIKPDFPKHLATTDIKGIEYVSLILVGNIIQKIHDFKYIKKNFFNGSACRYSYSRASSA